MLRHIVHFLGMKKAGSLRSCFDQWINDGEYAWVFDNAVDELSLSQPIFGFDMTDVLKDGLLSGIIFFYLFYQIEKLIGNTRTRIVVAEGWLALRDNEFKKVILDWSSTNRKKNAFLIMDTQSPEDISKSDIGCKIIQESVTQVYFANPSAKYEEYVEKFNLTHKEFQIVKTLGKESRYFLLKQGKRSVVVRLHLPSEFKDDINILSHRSDRDLLLQATLHSHGPDPKQWLPVYCQRVREKEAADVVVSR